MSQRVSHSCAIDVWENAMGPDCRYLAEALRPDKSSHTMWQLLHSGTIATFSASKSEPISNCQFLTASIIIQCLFLTPSPLRDYSFTIMSGVIFHYFPALCPPHSVCDVWNIWVKITNCKHTSLFIFNLSSELGAHFLHFMSIFAVKYPSIYLQTHMPVIFYICTGM